MTQTAETTPMAVVRLLDGNPGHDGDGVRLTRILEPALAALADPFLLFDEFGSEQPEDYVGGFPPHPHRGFETVTVMLAGRMRHRDNHGHSGELGPGAVQWMCAGRGIVHEEMPLQEEGLMWGFQLWINLPAAHKMDPPAYQDIAAERIAVAAGSDGVSLRVISGAWQQADGSRVDGAVRQRPTAPSLFDISLQAGARFSWVAPAEQTILLHGIEGTPAVSGAALRPKRMAVLHANSQARLLQVDAGDQPARLLLAAARPLREPIAHFGPFVMNTRDEVMQAVHDYQAGRF